MNSVYSILESIEAEQSRLRKEQILLSNIDNKLLIESFRLAYDPMISYLIRKSTSYTISHNPSNNLEWAMA